MGLAFGLGIRDFGKGGEYSLSEMWKMKQKHIDAYNLVEAVKSYPQIPTTFDGELPLCPEDMRNRIQVGERYFFPRTLVRKASWEKLRQPRCLNERKKCA